VDQPGTLIDPQQDRVEVEGRHVQPPAVFSYVLLNKPDGYLVSKSDPHHTKTVFKLLEGLPDNLVAVGRLDLDTTGVLLLTGDGDLCHRLTHPRFQVEKTYRAAVWGIPDAGDLKRMREGVALEDGTTAPARVKILKKERPGAVLELTLHEGRKRQVKMMCRAIDHRVRELARTSFAGLTTAGLKPGQWRELTGPEVGRLRKMVGLSTGTALDKKRDTHSGRG